MKGLKFGAVGSSFSVRFFTPAVALLTVALQAQAQIVPLSDNNSSALINASSQAGMFNWTVDGVNQLAQQWFWYRVDSSPQQSIDTISAPSITTVGLNTARITYNNNSFSVEVDYTLQGQTSGSGQANIREDIRIHNFSTTNSLDFHFFQYSDFDLGGQVGGDTVSLGKDLSGKFNEALQTKGSSIFSETDVTPGANHGMVTNFPNLLNLLNSGSAINLNDSTGPLGPGDETWALQWDYSGVNAIGPGADALISKQKFLQVPEPSALVMISLGAVAYALHRRRQSQHGHPPVA